MPNFASGLIIRLWFLRTVSIAATPGSTALRPPPKPSTVCEDVVAATTEAIRNPIGTKPLREIVHAGETVTIVISDITRLCGTSEFLPVIVAELNSVGVKDEDITVIVATGTHRNGSS